MTTYRAEIDGLRGLSVLFVMLFHANYPFITGGFVGVDVFFVISGYLITSIILNDLRDGRFSLSSFFERRARRILPALLVVLVVSVPFAVLWLLPVDRAGFFNSVLSAVFFFSNFFFYFDSGYFSAATELKPLIHTWSLAIEEQFYIVFPFLVLICRRWLPRRTMGVLAGVMALSFTVAVYLGPRYPDAAFFLPVTRAWQLLGGALLAYYQSTNRSNSRVDAGLLAESLTLLAVAVLVSSAFILDGESPFLARTLIPSAATIVIIACVQKTRLSLALLAWRPLVLLGLASYSAYLWHQPVLAFARHRIGTELSLSIATTCLLMSVGLAAMSLLFVERPFRDRSSLSRAKFFAVIFSLALAVVGSAIVGLRLNVELDRLLERADLFEALSTELLVPPGLDTECRFGPSADKNCRSGESPNVLLWGDSNAMQLGTGLATDDEAFVVWQATRPGCGPFVDIAPRRGNDTQTFVRSCLDDSRRLFEMIHEKSTLRIAVLSSSFWRYLDPAVELVSRNGSEPGGQDVAEGYLVHSIERLRSFGLRVVLVSPAPQTGANLGRCVASARIQGRDPAQCNFLLSEVGQRYKRVRDFLRRMEKRGYEVLFLEDFLCSKGVCRSTQGTAGLYSDESHLSKTGVAAVGQWIRKRIAEVEHIPVKSDSREVQ